MLRLSCSTSRRSVESTCIAESPNPICPTQQSLNRTPAAVALHRLESSVMMSPTESILRPTSARGPESSLVCRPRRIKIRVCKLASPSPKPNNRSVRTTATKAPRRLRNPSSNMGAPGGVESRAIGTTSCTSARGRAQDRPASVKTKSCGARAWPVCPFAIFLLPPSTNSRETLAPPTGRVFCLTTRQRVFRLL
jgi:hypothetical protein